MKAEIISIGDEILIGQVMNTNAGWLAEQMNLIGISVVRITTIGDNKEEIIGSLDDAGKRADIILITGGLGPTRDDITKQTLCEYFDTVLKFNKQAFRDIEKLFEGRGWQMNEKNKKQAELPANAVPLTNKNGTAPGMWFEQDGKIIVSLPGVPFEMKPMITDQVIPKLSEKLQTDTLYHKTVLTQGMGESWISDKIEDWEDKLPENIKLAYLPQPGMVRLRLSATGQNKKELEKQVDEEIEKLKKIIPDLIFGYNNDTLEEVVGKHLRNNRATVATAESCTGGYIAHLITSVSGSSDYYPGSVVSYSNEVKIKELGVSEDDLEKHGAVSEAVVRQMAEGVMKKFGTDYAISTSGIAGPTGGTDEKPVGTTWIAVCSKEKTIAKKFSFGNNRGRNIRVTALQAMNMLRKMIIKN